MSTVVRRGQPASGDGPGGFNNTDTGDSNSSSDSWWWSSSGMAVRWAIVAGIFVVFLLCIVAAYTHAQRRMKTGLQPLPYHRWLVRRHQRAQFAPQDQNNFSYGQRNDYNLHPYGPYAAPPPAYNAEHNYVPAYSPPADGSKIKMKDETTAVPEDGPSQHPAVADSSSPMYS